MRKFIIKVAVVIALIGSIGLSSCIGSFSLTNRLLSWNRSLGNKVVNELVFFAFWVLPVYEVSAMADFIVLNSIEFWSGSNPMAHSTKKIQGEDGTIYLVKCDGKGYDIISRADGSKVRLDFAADEQRWDVTLPSGQTYELMTMIDSRHVALPAPGGERRVVELSAQGLMAYSAMANGSLMAMR